MGLGGSSSAVVKGLRLGYLPEPTAEAFSFPVAVSFMLDCSYLVFNFFFLVNVTVCHSDVDSSTDGWTSLVAIVVSRFGLVLASSIWGVFRGYEKLLPCVLNSRNSCRENAPLYRAIVDYDD